MSVMTKERIQGVSKKVHKPTLADNTTNKTLGSLLYEFFEFLEEVVIRRDNQSKWLDAETASRLDVK